ncbi:unnamed protein product [Caenorhabditis auriculariae]|uniref:Uncharacterized protein n=1 Tax=Caenorhabditis auriculariae TaxID=2777116 RepID=A0A8S1HVX2_9PELO|nr:unnamed protein product [Caenorhabditis auriculariae]
MVHFVLSNSFVSFAGFTFRQEILDVGREDRPKSRSRPPQLGSLSFEHESGASSSAILRPQLTLVRKMARSEVFPFWMKAWLFASAVICAVDVTFTMLRPYTNDPNNVLSYTVFYGWNLYASVDIRYADTNDLVTCSTGRVMLGEIILNFIALYLAKKRSRHAVLTAFVSSVMVFWKTVWYFSLYIQPPPGNPSKFAEDKSLLSVFLIFFLPNVFWVILPFACIVALWPRLALPLEFEDQLNNNYVKAEDREKA